jgi:hypothetical protein
MSLFELATSRLTGCAGPRAHREVREWIKNNETLRTLRYGRFRRLLLWSADRPIIFALLMGAFAIVVAYIITGNPFGNLPQFPRPKLDPKFDPSAYTGVPWSVQATLVALV